jgi:hypothetical protein
VEVLEEPRGRGISYKKLKRGRLTGLVKSCVGTAFSNTLLIVLIVDKSNGKTRKNT